MCFPDYLAREPVQKTSSSWTSPAEAVKSTYILCWQVARPRCKWGLPGAAAIGGDEILPALHGIAAGQFNRHSPAHRRQDRNLQSTCALHGRKACCANLMPSHALLGQINSSHDSRCRNRVDMCRSRPPTCSSNIRARPCGSAATRPARRTRRSPAARPPRLPGVRSPCRRRPRRPRSPARA